MESCFSRHEPATQFTRTQLDEQTGWHALPPVPESCLGLHSQLPHHGSQSQVAGQDPLRSPCLDPCEVCPHLRALSNQPTVIYMYVYNLRRSEQTMKHQIPEEDVSTHRTFSSASHTGIATATAALMPTHITQFQWLLLGGLSSRRRGLKVAEGNRRGEQTAWERR